MTNAEIETLLSPACAWVAEQERMILQSGIPLNKVQLADARQIGVSQAERVRLLSVTEFPKATLHSRLNFA